MQSSMTAPEAEARAEIDNKLISAGWQIQDVKRINLGTGTGIAVREFHLNEGRADYVLFVRRRAVGVIEAKPRGTTLSGVAEQSDGYAHGVPENVPHISDPLPFIYESTGVETYFRDLREPEPRSRRVFSFHRPETMEAWLLENDTLRGRLCDIPPLIDESLRECQKIAIENLDESFRATKPRALIQMATGSGKTYTAVSFIYRLIKHANARRVLFLVDRSNLGRQTKKEFQQYITPDDGRKFTELYNIQHLNSNTLDPVSRVCITTIQRLYSMLRGDEEFEEDLEEGSLFERPPPHERQRDVGYDPKIPIETFDFIVSDECHRSIYNLWRQVLEYFDAFIIGLTATPSKQTLGFFNKNLVMEYSHERAVADGVNVGYEVYRIKTRITEEGSTVEAGNYVDRRDRETRRTRWERLDDDLEYGASRLDRDVVSKDQIRTVTRTFRDRLFTDIFPGRKEVPKTLVFAKDDSHAEDIVHICREEFGKGNDFCKKITYRTTGEKPEDLIQSFRNSYNPRIAVTVDMVSTGTDIKPLECLLFMRNVRSLVYFEQMKGRGTRTISSTDFKGVTPDAEHKTHFVIVDAVGVCEDDKTDSRPLERKKYIAFDKLLREISWGNRTVDNITTLAGRLSRLDRKLDDDERAEIAAGAGGAGIKTMINGLLDAVDPDVVAEKAREMSDDEKPTETDIKRAAMELIEKACKPFDDPDLRELINNIKRKTEQIIDNVSEDQILYAGYDEAAKERAQATVDTFKKFIDENHDELTALQIIYEKPYGQRHVTYGQIKELAKAIERPPYELTTDKIWNAYEHLEKAKVKGAGPQKLLTNIVSLVRFAVGEAEVLEPFPDTVDERFTRWLTEQQLSGIKYTPEQVEWLVMIKDHIAASLAIEMDDLQDVPFNQKGGVYRAYEVFGEGLAGILGELNEVLTA